MRQWRTASLKLVKDARLEEHLGKPTWAAEVRRWAKEFDREAVLSAEQSTPRGVPRTAQQRQLPGGQSPTGVPLPRGTGGRCCFLPLPVPCPPPEKRWRLAARGEAVVWDSQSPLHGSHRREDKTVPAAARRKPSGISSPRNCGLAMKMFEEVVGERRFCGCGRGLTPRCLEWFRALEQEDKLLLVLAAPCPPRAQAVSRTRRLATRRWRSWRSYGPPATRP